MDFPSSPPVLYLGDDDDDDDDDNNHGQNHYFETNVSLPRASPSVEMSVENKKRKISDTNVRVNNSSIANQSKRQRNDHYQQKILQNLMDSELDSELILLDPDEYVIEKPDSQPYRSFDWTIQPQPPSSSPVMPPKISSNRIQTASRGSTANVNNTTKRSIDKPDGMAGTNAKNTVMQQPRRSIAMPSLPLPRPSLALLSLPSTKPNSLFPRSASQRGRPLKNSRVPTIPSTSIHLPPPPRPVQSIFTQKQPTPRPSLSTMTTATSTTVSPSSINNPSLEIRRQVLNGTGIFSAFHDSKYYRCNICKFKSVTSSTLLQHLFTHMFFCEHCSFYTYSYLNLSQHMFEKHNLNLIEDIPQPLNPKSFDLLYVTRCVDGTFALCMDSSATPTTNKTTNNDQRLIISSATPTTDQQANKSSKKKPLQKNDLSSSEDTHVNDEKREKNLRSLVRSKREETPNQTYVLMKHRRCYSMKKSPCLHSLTLEYNICREHTIRHISHTQDIDKSKKYSPQSHIRSLIDEVANCLKTIVNNIVDHEDISNQSSLIQILPNDILNRIFPMDNLNMLTNLLKLNNKSEQYIKQNQFSDDEYSLRRSDEHVFILSSSETNHTEQSIISSLHSSLTNGDSIFTHTKIHKLPTNFDNTHRYLKDNASAFSIPTNQPLVNNSKVRSPSPKPPPLRPIVCKPSRSLSNSSVDRNNNPIAPAKSKSIAPSVIILD